MINTPVDLFDVDEDETYDWLKRTGKLDSDGRPLDS